MVSRRYSILFLVAIIFLLSSCDTARRKEAAHKRYVNSVGYAAKYYLPKDGVYEISNFFRAQNGNAIAQNNTGWMYEHGIGLHKNIETAISWYLKAAKQGHNQAKINLRRLEKSIPNYNQIIEKYIEPKNQVRVTQREKSTVDSDKIVAASSGTGFIVSSNGHIITNNHVIKGCANVKVHQNGKDYPATVVATDNVNDLALLKTTLKTKGVFPLSNKNAFLMQDIFVAGYPFGKAVSSSVKVTKGIVSALSGLRNNYSNMQIDAALQPGNSGGPILDEKGNAVGVAVAKLSLAKAVKDWGVVPEGTNFGIKSSVVRNFMESNNVNPMPPRTFSITKQQLAQKVTSSTLYLSCWMTYAKIKQMKSEKVMFTNFE